MANFVPVDVFDLVIFGGTGDLAMRKLLPALYHRVADCQITGDSRIIAASRGEVSRDAYLREVEEALRSNLSDDEFHDDQWAELRERIHYVQCDARAPERWMGLVDLLAGHDDRIRVAYLATAPVLFGPIAQGLRDNGLIAASSRIVLEKPLGHDYASACEINNQVGACFAENQIYRIDHYLGKETVQNLMAVRFGNMLFEPLWKNQYIDHVQITVAETVGVGGRGAYYDKSGAMRDMVQNHLMQLLCLIAMEPPAKFDPDAVRDEKLKVIRALQPVDPHHIVRGQYDAGPKGASYREDAGQPRSHTESFVAMKCHIANWRWAGVPFYLRTGKRMKARSSEIAVVFQDLGHTIFEGDVARHRNILSIRLQPNEGMDLQVTIKEPGPGGMRLADVPLDMSFKDALGPDAEEAPEAYERLIMDVIRGNQTLFMRGDEVEAAWAWTDPVIAGWQSRGDAPKPYASGSTGPVDADVLMKRDDRRWRGINP